MNGPKVPEPVFAGVRAAGLLEEACRAGSAGDGRLRIVRDLALDLGRQLGALADLAGEDAAPDVLAEATLCCADLANLAACNAPGLPPDAEQRAVAAARLAAGAVNALVPEVEAGSREVGEEHAGNLIRDARSAAWRAGFAARLVEGFPEGLTG